MLESLDNITVHYKFSVNKRYSVFIEGGTSNYVILNNNSNYDAKCTDKIS